MKSLLSRGKIEMKHLVGLIFVCEIIFLCSCSDTTVNLTSSSGPITLSGTIVNWTKSGNKLRAEFFDSLNLAPVLMFDSNIVSVNSAFTLRLNNPTYSTLYPIIFYSDSSWIINMTVDPPNTKSNLLRLNVYDSMQMRIGDIYRSNYSVDSLKQGQFFVWYVYLNQNVSITGSTIHSYSGSYDTTIYDFRGVRGWNKMVNLLNSYTSNSTKTTVSANEPVGGKWYFAVCTKDVTSNRLFLRECIFRPMANGLLGYIY